MTTIKTKHESHFSRERAKDYKAVGAVIFVCTGSLFQGSGWPDWWIGHKLFTGWLELKVGKNTCSDAQVARLKKIRKANVPAFVYRLVGELETLELEDGTQLYELEGSPMLRLSQMSDCWDYYKFHYALE